MLFHWNSLIRRTQTPLNVHRQVFERKRIQLVGINTVMNVKAQTSTRDESQKDVGASSRLMRYCPRHP